MKDTFEHAPIKADQPTEALRLSFAEVSDIRATILVSLHSCTVLQAIAEITLKNVTDL